MKKILKIMTVFLAALLLFSACKKDDGKQNDNSKSTGTAAPKDFPLEKKTFGGMTFRVFSDYNAPDALDFTDFALEGDSEVTIDSAVYRRNALVSELFDVKLECASSQNDTFVPEMRKQMRSQDDIYALIATRFVSSRTLILDDCAYDLLPYSETLSLDCNWWDQAIQTELAINNRLYLIDGDFFFKHYDGVELLQFNKRIAEDELADTNLYQLVKDGAWTLEKFRELCTGISKDLDGDQLITSDQDRFAFSSQIDAVSTFIISAGNRLVSHTSDGKIEFTENTDKIYQTIDKVLKFYVDETWDAHRDVACAYGPLKIFSEGRSLFNWTMARFLENPLNREMADDFGILPFPKYDETQADYINYVNFYHGYALMMPSSVKAPDDVAYITNALAFYGKQLITPTYYETLLTTRYVRDDESAEIIDMIFVNTTYDMAIYYDIGGIRDVLQKSFYEGQNVFSSAFAANRDILARDIDEINDYEGTS